MRRRSALRAGSAAFAGLALGGGLYAWLRQGGAGQIARVTCPEVPALAADLAAGRLTAGRAEALRAHVRECRNCRPLFPELA